MRVREVIALVEKDGWMLVRTTGSDRHFKHTKTGGIVTVSGNLQAEMPKGTLNNVLRQAGLK